VTCTTGGSQPRNADPVLSLKALYPCSSLDDISYNFVAGHQRQFRLRQLTVHDVQVRSADCARLHPYQHLTRPGYRLRQIRFEQRKADSLEEHCAHNVLRLPPSRFSTISSQRIRQPLPSLWAIMHICDKTAHIRADKGPVCSGKRCGTSAANDGPIDKVFVDRSWARGNTRRPNASGLTILSAFDGYKRVLAATDFSGRPRQSMRRRVRTEAKNGFKNFLSSSPASAAKIRPSLSWGVPRREIRRIARRRKADLVALVTGGRSGVKGLLLGITAAKVLATCDVASFP
jgi:hypothetical protein